MTKKRIKKLLFPLFASSLSIFCVAGLIYVVKERDPEEMRKELFVKRVHNSIVDYDFGLATDPINNLNYVRYKSVDKVLPSLVDSFIKNGPNNALKRLISTNQFAMTVVDTSKSLDEKKNLLHYLMIFERTKMTLLQMMDMVLLLVNIMN
ncbi:hypothetical protein [Mycoplasmopsis cynos]|uniref:hypothetical protein n=1 Tax=Mycoplasmopsis cynos TaxID=171284 RepID=UPI00220CF6AC|nr:hypothetical protein [Mycoplasmopsis cynos]UWV83063.1 hypothetical protein NW067_02155 [Mycoplasmopsis cynos]